MLFHAFKIIIYHNSWQFWWSVHQCLHTNNCNVKSTSVFF